jgi:LPS O-antigen subunit length determinant protein (WzzB/FepE family)
MPHSLHTTYNIETINEFMTPQEQLETRRLVQDPQDSVYEPEGKHFIEPLIVMAKHKVLILGTAVGAALLSIVIALLLPQYFTAEAKLLPPQQAQSMASAMMSQLGQLAPPGSRRKRPRNS